MKEINAYLNFDGNTREAMTFYQKCLGAELTIQTYGEAHAPGTAGDRVIHARLSKGAAVLMASDTQPGDPFTAGNNFWVCIQSESAAELDAQYAALSTGGKVTMPPGDTFWNARFGMLTDKFGVNWMLNYEYPKKVD
jgi:PhnB protein